MMTRRCERSGPIIRPHSPDASTSTAMSSLRSRIRSTTTIQRWIRLALFLINPFMHPCSMLSVSMALRRPAHVARCVVAFPMNDLTRAAHTYHQTYTHTTAVITQTITLALCVSGPRCWRRFETSCLQRIGIVIHSRHHMPGYTFPQGTRSLFRHLTLADIVANSVLAVVTMIRTTIS